MSDRPWLEDADPSLRAERELLKRLNAQQPPANGAEQGWAALSAEIAGLHASPLQPEALGPSLAASGAAGLGIAAKIAVGFAIVGGALWVGSEVSKPSGTATSASPRQLNVPIPPPVVPALVSDEALAPPAPQQPPPASPPRVVSPATTLAEEGRLLAKAHQLVQAGQGLQALEVLRASEARYPRSALAQEREVLRIEALNATGASGVARQRAERFLKRYPSSPHAGRLERFVE